MYGHEKRNENEKLLLFMYACLDKAQSFDTLNIILYFIICF
jgi:hypothetical protein